MLSCVGIFLFATGWVRNIFGDVLVVIFLVSSLASIPLGRPWMRICAVGFISVGVESFQSLGLVTPDTHWVAHLVIGSTYDPVDLAAYALGLCIAAGAERLWAVQVQRPEDLGVVGAGDTVVSSETLKDQARLLVHSDAG